MNFRLILLLLAFVTSYGCSSPPGTGETGHAGAKSRITITGSSTLAPLITEIAKSYELQHPSSRIDVQAGGSSRGMTDVKQGIAQIGMVSKHVPSDDKIHAHLIARDGVAVIVHKDNPLTSIDKKTIENIYTGNIKNWSMLDAQNNNDIVVISKAEGRSTLTVFLEYLGLQNSKTKPSIIIGDNEQAIKLVSNNTNALAYVSTSTAEYNIQHDVPIKTLAIDNIKPIEKNIASGRFPIVRELNLVTKPSLSQSTQNFIEFIISEEAQSLTKEFQFVPIL